MVAAIVTGNVDLLPCLHFCTDYGTSFKVEHKFRIS
jgi:hypothetical protein